MKHTTIIATIGPASEKEETIEKLARAGVNVFRMNFSHGDYASHKKVFKAIRRVSEKLNSHIGILQDLQGPKIRVGLMAGGAAQIADGSELTIVTKEIEGNSCQISTTYKHLPKDIKAGDRILLDDGNLELTAIKAGKDYVCARVVHGGLLKSHKGINLPGVSVSAPSLTPKDLADMKYGLELGVDMLAISFVRKPEDIIQARNLIKKHGGDVPIVAKIERPEAIKNLKGILEATDCIMIARGDLGVEMPPEKVPELQKMMIEQANARGKGVITATQMLESMISNPRPTRAEASDVANAVYDGTGAVMLSGETAAGQFPVEAVEMMSRIVSEAEHRVVHKLMFEPTKFLVTAAGYSGAIAFAAARSARELGAKAIVAFTQTGTTAQLISKFRPECLIIGATLDERIARRMSLYWGVIPLVFKKIHNTETLVQDVDERMLQTKLVRRGDVVVITTGVPIGASGTTNMMKIHRIGELD
ncbi:MAG: pyruvate kinase [bacterium]